MDRKGGKRGDEEEINAKVAATTWWPPPLVARSLPGVRDIEVRVRILAAPLVLLAHPDIVEKSAAQRDRIRDIARVQDRLDVPEPRVILGDPALLREPRRKLSRLADEPVRVVVVRVERVSQSLDEFREPGGIHENSGLPVRVSHVASRVETPEISKNSHSCLDCTYLWNPCASTNT